MSMHTGNALEILKGFKDESIDCVVTSPPYWNLRDYGDPGQIGMELTYYAYLENLLSIFDQIKRVLKPEGTVWVNLGDTYGTQSGAMRQGKFGPKNTNNQKFVQPKSIHKCLLMIPARFAIEMINRGWILRNEIIWHKPNALPQSATDRLTVDYEKMFFFVKSRKYFFDQKAIAEPITDATVKRILMQNTENQAGSSRTHGGMKHNGPMKAVLGKGYTPKMAGGGSSMRGHSGYKRGDGTFVIRPDRNKRTVWSIPTKPFTEAHFAVYPEELIEAPIKAGCPKGGVVLDPFMGSGTTAVVAEKLGRQWVGIDINPEYVKLAEKRVRELPAQLFK